MKKSREIISISLCLLLLIVLLLFAGRLLLPKDFQAGIDWDAYLMEPENSIDILYAGSSMTFCNIAPAVVYEHSGITGYVIAGPEQTVPVSYYYIAEACRTQKPKAVFLELGGMFFTRYENHTASNIAFMPRGINRLCATFNAAEGENVPGLILPVLEYHSRWNSITLSEVVSKLKAETSGTAGYELQREASPQGDFEYRELTDSYYDYSLEYLKKTASFCREQGIELYLFLAPTVNRTPPELQKRLETDIADLDIAAYIDFNTEENFAQLGLDSERDWVDGLHLNVFGARKLSENIAQRLIGLGYSPTRNADRELWQERIEALES